jgi:hypothetical protein
LDLPSKKIEKVNENSVCFNRKYCYLSVNITAGFIYFNKIYIKPWCRVGPFVIGILLGYFLYEHKTKKQNQKIQTVSLI